MGVRFSLEAVLFWRFLSMCQGNIFLVEKIFLFLCWLAGCGGPSASVEDISTRTLEVLLCSGLLPTSLPRRTLLYLLWPLRVVCCSCDQFNVHNGVYDWKSSQLPITPSYHLWKCKMNFQLWKTSGESNHRWSWWIHAHWKKWPLRRLMCNTASVDKLNVSASFNPQPPTWWQKNYNNA